jgi:hypothetical protein
MSICLIGNPPFPAAQLEGRMTAKVEHVWHSVRRWAKQHGYQYTSSYGVIDVAPT